MESIKIYIAGFGELYLDERCCSCNSYREYNEICGPVITEKDGECSICHGKKFVLTSAGEKIMELIKRHGGK